MISIAVCDDEKYMSDMISVMVSDFFRKRNIDVSIIQFSGGKELLKYHKKIDILFLDIQMKDIDGMETARKLRCHKFKGFLIFITILREMVFQSFEVQAFDYLVKPIEPKYFEKMMNRLLVSMRNSSEACLLVQKDMKAKLFLLKILYFAK